ERDADRRRPSGWRRQAVALAVRIQREVHASISTAEAVEPARGDNHSRRAAVGGRDAAAPGANGPTFPEGNTLMRALMCVGLMLTLAAAGGAGCRKAEQAPPLKELQRARSGTINVVLLSDADALRRGKDSFVLEFRG